MDRDVNLVVNDERYFIGSVEELLRPDAQQIHLRSVVRDVVDNLVFSDNSGDYIVCSIEVR